MSIRGDPNPDFRKEVKKRIKKQIKKQIREAIDSNRSFKRRLKDLNIEGKYIRNVTDQILKEYNMNSRLGRTISSIKDPKCSNANKINYTLTWGNTKEGHYYWADIHKKI